VLKSSLKTPASPQHTPFKQNVARHSNLKITYNIRLLTDFIRELRVKCLPPSVASRFIANDTGNRCWKTIQCVALPHGRAPSNFWVIPCRSLKKVGRRVGGGGGFYNTDRLTFAIFKALEVGGR
jgi:hypothetical protein